MKIVVRLFGSLQQYRPGEAPGRGSFEIEMADDATVADLAARLGMPPEKARFAFIGGESAAPERSLHPDESIVFAAPMGGGAFTAC